MKFIREDKISSDDDFQMIFEQEISNLEAVKDKDHLVQMLGFCKGSYHGNWGGFILFEWIDGVNLKKVILDKKKWIKENPESLELV